MALDQDKSHDPTPHRRKLLRERGQVAHSQDLSSAGVLLASLGAIALAGAALIEYLAMYLGSCLSGQAWLAWLDSTSSADQLAAGQWNVLAGGLARALLPVLGLVALAAVFVNMAQTGFLISPQKLIPDWSRVNPLLGAGRILSASNFARVAFGLLKLAAIAGVAGASLYARFDELLSLSGLDLMQLTLALWSIVLGTCVNLALALLAIAALDYLWQRWKLEREARMTPEEVREELRNLQVDPLLAARRRALARQRAAEQAAAKGQSPPGRGGQGR